MEKKRFRFKIVDLIFIHNSPTNRLFAFLFYRCNICFGVAQQPHQHQGEKVASQAQMFQRMHRPSLTHKPPKPQLVGKKRGKKSAEEVDSRIMKFYLKFCAPSGKGVIQ